MQVESGTKGITVTTSSNLVSWNFFFTLSTGITDLLLCNGSVREKCRLIMLYKGNLNLFFISSLQSLFKFRLWAPPGSKPPHPKPNFYCIWKQFERPLGRNAFFVFFSIVLGSRMTFELTNLAVWPDFTSQIICTSGIVMKCKSGVQVSFFGKDLITLARCSKICSCSKVRKKWCRCTVNEMFSSPHLLFRSLCSDLKPIYFDYQAD